MSQNERVGSRETAQDVWDYLEFAGLHLTRDQLVRIHERHVIDEPFLSPNSWRDPRTTYAPGTTDTYLHIPTGSANISVGTDGSVNYTDEAPASPTFGQTVTAGYLSLATFPNQNGLQRVGRRDDPGDLVPDMEVLEQRLACGAKVHGAGAPLAPANATAIPVRNSMRRQRCDASRAGRR